MPSISSARSRLLTEASWTMAIFPWTLTFINSQGVKIVFRTLSTRTISLYPRKFSGCPEKEKIFTSPRKPMCLGNFAQEYILVSGVRKIFSHYQLPTYSTISSLDLLSTFAADAASRDRSALAVRPCLPMTLPKSSGATASSRITLFSSSVRVTLTASG